VALAFGHVSTFQCWYLYFNEVMAMFSMECPTAIYHSY
jgi:hypothetical protein